MPTHSSEADLQRLVRAAIEAYAKQATSCTRSPAAPDGHGWGVPSWRDESAYPAADALNLQEWRWEFLRRNHGYRLDWLRLDHEYQSCSKLFYFEQFYGLNDTPDPSVSVLDIHDFERQNEIHGRRLFRRTGSLKDHVNFIEERLAGRYASLYEIERIFPTLPDPTDVYVRFDMWRPLKPQFKSIMQLLEKNQKADPRFRTRQQRVKWPLYLRLLDAADAGASYGAMKELLRTGSRTEHSARDLLQAAERLRQAWRY